MRCDCDSPTLERCQWIVAIVIVEVVAVVVVVEVLLSPTRTMRTKCGRKEEGQGGGDDDDGWIRFSIWTCDVIVRITLTRKETCMNIDNMHVEV